MILVLAAGVSSLLFGGDSSSYFYYEESTQITTTRRDADGNIVTNTQRSGGVRTNMKGTPPESVFAAPPSDYLR